ncbi:response regulator [Mastigocoleus testarum]|uniref:NagC family transcriptional regulator n=1 Tax=Mastigocoleus testarum BC008 TaxID=371196 RepID=A0A0V7ZLS5_9CYAN|nr:response regulator transcription factor [Mastigocoleus testarum]KST65254.1 NagC family transcriptional regulator [Mastigocoleus testarum BC008]
MSEVRENSPIRVLLAEDHNLIRLGLKGQFSLEKEFEVVGEAKNGQEAIQLTNEINPDVVLMDIDMPVVDGITATQEIKNGANPPRVIALSAFGEDSQVIAMLAAGADGYCLKTIEWPQLLAVIRLIQGGGTYLDPQIAYKVAIMLKSTVTPSPKPAIGDSPVPVLSDREREVLQMISEGMSNPEISKQLYLSLGTVKSYVRNILNKLSVDDRVQAAAKAVREGLI